LKPQQKYNPMCQFKKPSLIPVTL